MFYAFVGLGITAVAVGYLSVPALGWLTLGVGTLILSGVDGVVSYLEDQRIERMTDCDI
jgi:hypothetical protein